MAVPEDMQEERVESPGGPGIGNNTAQGLALHCRLIEEGCIECGLCEKDCLFLQRHGSPKKIAGEHGAAVGDLRFSFECSLCGLCTAVCPKQVDPAAMFATMRVAGQGQGGGEFRQHAGLLRYESLGASPLLSWHGLPAGCDTVFFPGCAMAGSRAARVTQAYRHLRTMIPSLGLVLDCCGKPSHDLGRRDNFHRLFGALRRALEEKGVKTVLVACPSCYRVWSDYGGSIAARSVYEELAAGPPVRQVRGASTLTVHDPCPTRNDTAVHTAVRSMLASMGFNLKEMKHHGRKTVCCGEGGAACYLDPALAGNWTAIRAREADGQQLVTYCAGCTNFLGRVTPTAHVLDLFFAPEKSLAGRVRVTRSPLTWLSRLLLKAGAKGLVRPAVTGVRGKDGQVIFRER